ncbi:hypothetical protein VTK26DRAFT_4770 [Humicola hyalothermophila]
MRQDILLAALSALTVVAAQSQSQNFTINPGSVDPGLKAQWCNAQYDSCNTLCGSTPNENDCRTETLEYNCTCANGTAPGLEYYTQTMPTFICNQAYSDCIEANVGSSRGQDECKKNIKSRCGTLDPNKASTGGGGSSQTTSSAGQSSTQGPTNTQDAQNAPSTSTSSGIAAATTAALIGKGVAVAAAGVFAALL